MFQSQTLATRWDSKKSRSGPGVGVGTATASEASDKAADAHPVAVPKNDVKVERSPAAVLIWEAADVTSLATELGSKEMDRAEAGPAAAVRASVRLVEICILALIPWKRMCCIVRRRS